MSIAFMATLRTNRDIERGVIYFGSDQASVETSARKWLESFGEHGDFFDIIENLPTARGIVECTKKPKPPREYKGSHPFRHRSGIHCDVCGRTDEEHA